MASNAAPNSMCATSSPAEGVASSALTEHAEALASVLEAYGRATERLQASHEHLSAEVVRLRERLASKDAQLQRSRRLAALGQMAAGIAHEIRNPLGALALYAGVLEEDLAAAADADGGQPVRVEDAGRLAGVARQMVDAVRGLDGIVNDVLTFSRELQPRLGVVDVGEVLCRAAQSHQPAINRAGVRVACDGRGVLVRVDANLLHQAVLNLVRNAVDAMASADGPRDLTLDARGDGTWVKLTVRDTGPGIDDADIDRIFNPFFTTRSTGTGLGLAIVHRIVDAHGGTISVHHDDGAVFELNLPVNGPELVSSAGVDDADDAVNAEVAVNDGPASEGDVGRGEAERMVHASRPVGASE